MLLAAVAAPLTPLLASTAPPQATAYQITVDHAGVTASGGVLAPEPWLLWSVKLPGAISYPVIAGGAVFVTTAGIPGSTYGTQLWALDAQSGATRWGPIAVPGNYLWSNATYEAGKLFVVTYSGELLSFDAATGAAGWSVQLPGQYAFSSPPTASGGIVYVGGAGSGGTLYAVTESNGAVLWSASVANGDHSSPAVGPGAVYVSYPCQVYSFDLATGGSNWHYNGGCDGGGGRTPVYAGGQIYVRDWTTPNASVFDAASGTITASFTAGPAPAIGTATGFFLNSGTLTAVDLATHHQQWAFAGDGSLSSAPIVVDQSVIVGGSSGMLYGLDVTSGTVNWQLPAASPILAPDEQNVSQPLTGLGIADGILVVPATDTLLGYALLAGPTALRVAGQAGAVSLSWAAAPAGTLSYNLYLGSAASGEAATPVQTGIADTSVTLTNLPLGTTYFFTVRAVSGAGISVPSNEVSATAHSPAAPTGLVATAGVDSVTLSWTDSADAQSYNVYVGTSSGGESQTPAESGILTNAATVSGLAAGAKYFFTVKSVAHSALSATSNEASATPTAEVALPGGTGSGDWLSALLLATFACWRARRSLSHGRCMA